MLADRTFALLLATTVACAPKDEDVSESKATAAIVPDSPDAANIQAAPKAKAKAPAASRKEHEGDGPVITRLAETLYWVDPGVVTATLSELAAGEVVVKGGAGGVVIEKVAEDSIPAKLGFAAGDVVTRLGGHPANSPLALEALHQQLWSGGTIDATVQRSGETLVHNYAFRSWQQPTSFADTRAQFTALLGLGLLRRADGTRAIDFNLFQALSSSSQIRASVSATGLLERLGLPKTAKIRSADVGEHRNTITIEDAFGRSEQIEVELIENLLNLDDLQAALDRFMSGLSERHKPDGVDEVRTRHDGTTQVPQDVWDGWLANPAQLARAARIVPSQKDGVVQGFKIYGIRRESIAKHLGFENGDLVVGINGQRLDDIENTMRIFTSLRDAKRIEFQVLRRTEPMTLVVEIVERGQ